MRVDLRGLRRLVEAGHANSVMAEIESLDKALRTTESLLADRVAELSRLRQQYRVLQDERDLFESRCLHYREWFVRKRLDGALMEIETASSNASSTPGSAEGESRST